MRKLSYKILVSNSVREAQRKNETFVTLKAMAAKANISYRASLKRLADCGIEKPVEGWVWDKFEQTAMHQIALILLSD